VHEGVVRASGASGSQGSDPTAVLHNLGDDANNKKLLLYAAASGNFDLVKDLCESPTIDLNHQDSAGNTALIYAALFWHDEIVAYLLNRGVNLYHQNKAGDNAFTCALLGKTRDIGTTAILLARDNPNVDLCSNRQLQNLNNKQIANLYSYARRNNNRLITQRLQEMLSTKVYTYERLRLLANLTATFLPPLVFASLADYNKVVPGQYINDPMPIVSIGFIGAFVLHHLWYYERTNLNLAIRAHALCDRFKMRKKLVRNSTAIVTTNPAYDLSVGEPTQDVDDDAVIIDLTGVQDNNLSELVFTGAINQIQSLSATERSRLFAIKVNGISMLKLAAISSRPLLVTMLLEGVTFAEAKELNEAFRSAAKYNADAQILWPIIKKLMTFERFESRNIGSLSRAQVIDLLEKTIVEKDEDTALLILKNQTFDHLWFLRINPWLTNKSNTFYSFTVSAEAYKVSDYIFTRSRYDFLYNLAVSVLAVASMPFLLSYSVAANEDQGFDYVIVFSMVFVTSLEFVRLFLRHRCNESFDLLNEPAIYQQAQSSNLLR
jgi:hypothetical protein